MMKTLLKRQDTIKSEDQMIGSLDLELFRVNDACWGPGFEWLNNETTLVTSNLSVMMQKSMSYVFLAHETDDDES
jgi:hypothetical protein